MTDRDLKDKQIRRAIDSYEKNNRTAATPEKRRELERHVVEKVMPLVDRRQK